MRISVSKKIIFYIFIPLSIFIIGYLFLSKGERFDFEKCKTEDPIGCRKAGVDTKTNTYYFSGKVIKKYFEKGVYYFELDVIDKNGYFHEIQFRLPPNPLKVYLNYTKGNERIVENLSPSEMYSRLESGKYIRVFINIASTQDISTARKILRDEYYVRCIDQDQEVSKFLFDPNILNKIIYMYKKNTSGCPVAVLSFEV